MVLKLKTTIVHVLLHFEFDTNVSFCCNLLCGCELSVFNSNGNLWLDVFSCMMVMRLKTNISNRTETCNTNAPDGEHLLNYKIFDMEVDFMLRYNQKLI